MAKSNSSSNNNAASALLDRIQGNTDMLDESITGSRAASQLGNPYSMISQRQLFQHMAFQIAMNKVISGPMAPIGSISKAHKREAAKHTIKEALQWVELIGEAYDELHAPRPRPELPPPENNETGEAP